MLMDKHNEDIIKISVQKGKFLKISEEKSLENTDLEPKGPLMAYTGIQISQKCNFLASQKLL